MAVGFRWLGVAGVELYADEAVLLIDPFVSRFPLRRAFSRRVRPDGALIAQHLPRADGVLVTHAHWDHLLDAPEIARQTGATVYGSANTCRLLALTGVPPEQCRQIAAGERFIVGPFTVTVWPARHVPLLRRPVLQGPLRDRHRRRPLRPWDYRMDLCFSFLVEAAGTRWLDWAGVSTDGAPPADVLFVTLFGPPARYWPLLAAVRPRWVIPVHWDNFFRPVSRPLRPLFMPTLRRANLDRFCRQLGQMAPGVQVLVPELFRTYDVVRTDNGRFCF